MLKRIINFFKEAEVEEVPPQPIPQRDIAVEGFNEWSKYIQNECRKNQYKKERKKRQYTDGI